MLTKVIPLIYYGHYHSIESDYLCKSLSVQTKYFMVQAWYQSWGLCSLNVNSFAIPCGEIIQNSEWSNLTNMFFSHDTCLFVCEHYSNVSEIDTFNNLSKIGTQHRGHKN